jgi:mRNA interferase HicA
LKRKLLIKKISDAGAQLVRHGANHDIYHNPINGKTQPIPRHNDINEFLAKKIIKVLIEND